MSTSTKILAILLMVSVGLNLLAGWAYLGQRDKTTVAQTEQRQTVAVATKCSEGTAKLETTAAQREADAAPARRQEQAKAAQHNRAADQVLAKSPAVPGNACASAQAELDDWWEYRK